MLKSIACGLVAAASIMAGSLSLSSPAEAHYTGYYHKHYYNPYVPHCYWTTRVVKIHTDYGPRWVERRVRVCR
jgi:hypothetical protein